MDFCFFDYLFKFILQLTNVKNGKVFYYIFTVYNVLYTYYFHIIIFQKLFYFLHKNDRMN